MGRIIGLRRSALVIQRRLARRAGLEARDGPRGTAPGCAGSRPRSSGSCARRVGDGVVGREVASTAPRSARDSPGRPAGSRRRPAATIMSSARAIRDGASSVAAWMPKNGTNAASRVPKSMSGRLKKASPRRIARKQRLRPASSREKISALPRRRRPRRSAAIEHRIALALVDRDALLVLEQQHRRAGDVEAP